jgi:hypothetical protein
LTLGRRSAGVFWGWFAELLIAVGRSFMAGGEWIKAGIQRPRKMKGK